MRKKFRPWFLVDLLLVHIAVAVWGIWQNAELFALCFMFLYASILCTSAYGLEYSSHKYVNSKFTDTEILVRYDKKVTNRIPYEKIEGVLVCAAMKHPGRGSPIPLYDEDKRPIAALMLYESDTSFIYGLSPNCGSVVDGACGESNVLYNRPFDRDGFEKLVEKTDVRIHITEQIFLLYPRYFEFCLDRLLIVCNPDGETKRLWYWEYEKYKNSKTER